MTWNKFLLRTLITFICLWGSSELYARTASAQANDSIVTSVVDGPYVLYQTDGRVRVVSVNQNNQLLDTIYDTLPNKIELDVCCEQGRFPFKVSLHEIKRPEWKIKQPSNLFIMSDPHGNMDCVVSLLQGNGIIDENLKWSYGNNALVVIGDVFDRGEDVTQIFWLFYKLEKEAQDAGGNFIFLLGNHEPMVLSGDLRYTKEKYSKIAHRLDFEYPSLMGPQTEIGRWLSSRNTVTRIGKTLCVHAGLSKSLYEKKINIPTINTEMSRGLFMKKKARKKDHSLEFLYGSKGPIWYRGMVLKEKKYHPLSSKTLKKLLKYYGANRVIVGHTIFEDITSFYHGKVVAVNVDNIENKNNGLGRAIIIRGKKIFVVYDSGEEILFY